MPPRWWRSSTRPSAPGRRSIRRRRRSTRPPESVRAAMSRGGGIYATVAGRPAGVILVAPGGRRTATATFQRVSVHPDFQRHGVASAMITAAEELAATLGHRRVELFARGEFAELIAFWQHRGFVIDRDAAARGDPVQAAPGRGDGAHRRRHAGARRAAGRPAAPRRRRHRVGGSGRRQDHPHPGHRARPGQRRARSSRPPSCSPGCTPPPPAGPPWCTSTPTG